MSQQEMREYIFTFESIDLKGWDPNVHTRPSKISTFQYYPSLKEAFNSLATLDKSYFNEALSIKNNHAQIITNAFIMDRNGDILLMCRYNEDRKNVKLDGLFIELNSKRITKEEFERATEYSLGDLVQKGPLLDYYLFESSRSVQLTKEQNEVRRHIHNGPRQVQRDNLNGPKL